MTFQELIAMSLDDQVQWLVDDTHTLKPEHDRIRSEVLDCARSGVIDPDILRTYAEANRIAGERLQQEARELRAFGQNKFGPQVEPADYPSNVSSMAKAGGKRK